MPSPKIKIPESEPMFQDESVEGGKPGEEVGDFGHGLKRSKKIEWRLSGSMQRHARSDGKPARGAAKENKDGVEQIIQTPTREKEEEEKIAVNKREHWKGGETTEREDDEEEME